MNAVTITQITPSELESLISNVLKKELLETLPPIEKSDEWLNLDQLCKFIPSNPSKSTVYGWVSKGLIPFHKKGKSLIFQKSEINLWLKEGSKLQSSDIEKQIRQETDYHLSKKRGGRHE